MSLKPLKDLLLEWQTTGPIKGEEVAKGYGKLIGGTAGGALGGHLGSLVGMGLGSNIGSLVGDDMKYDNTKRSHRLGAMLNRVHSLRNILSKVGTGVLGASITAGLGHSEDPSETLSNAKKGFAAGYVAGSVPAALSAIDTAKRQGYSDKAAMFSALPVVGEFVTLAKPKDPKGYTGK